MYVCETWKINNYHHNDLLRTMMHLKRGNETLQATYEPHPGLLGVDPSRPFLQREIGQD
jgi:hypothetical protein